MSSHANPLTNQKPTHRNPAASFRWNFSSRRRIRLATVRLGGKRERRGLFLVRLCRKAKLKWMRVNYMRALLKKLKAYYASFVKDMMEGGGAIESFQQRMLLETSFAIPVMGLSFNSYPSTSGFQRTMFY